MFTFVTSDDHYKKRYWYSKLFFPRKKLLVSLKIQGHQGNEILLSIQLAFSKKQFSRRCLWRFCIKLRFRFVIILNFGLFYYPFQCTVVPYIPTNVKLSHIFLPMSNATVITYNDLRNSLFTCSVTITGTSVITFWIVPRSLNSNRT